MKPVSHACGGPPVLGDDPPAGRLAWLSRQMRVYSGMRVHNAKPLISRCEPETNAEGCLAQRQPPCA